MRIIYVTKHGPPEVGGMELHIASCAAKMAEYGHEVEILSGSAKQPSQTLSSGISVFRQSLFDLSGWQRLRIADVVHLHEARSWWVIVGAMLTPKATPIFFTPHCYYPARGLVNNCTKWMFDHLVLRWVIRRCAAVVSLTPVDAEHTRSIFGAAHTPIVPNAIDVELLTEQRRPLALSNGRFVLFTGRHDMNKNPAAIAAVAARLEQEFDLKVVFCGPPGEQSATVRAELLAAGGDPDAQILGLLPRPEVNWLIAHAEVVVLPSRAEGLPTSLVEAVAAGTPVAGSDNSGTQAFLSMLRAGSTFNPDDEESILRAVMAVINSSAEDRATDTALVRNRFSWAAVAQSLEDLYEGANSARPSPSGRILPIWQTDPIRLSRKCPVCDSSKFVDSALKDIFSSDLRTVVCQDCGHAYTNPVMRDIAYDTFYAKQYRGIYFSRRTALQHDSPDELELCSMRVSRYGEYLQEVNSMLDVGAGSALLLQSFMARKSAVVGSVVEPDRAIVSWVQSRNANVEWLGSVLDEVPPDRRFDAVSAFHVLEHIREPKAFLRTIASLQHHGGLLFLEVPDIAGPWRGVGMLHPAHVSHYSAPILERLLLQCGYRLESCLAWADRPAVESLSVVARREAGGTPGESVSLRDEPDLRLNDLQMKIGRLSAVKGRIKKRMLLASAGIGSRR